MHTIVAKDAAIAVRLSQSGVGLIQGADDHGAMRYPCVVVGLFDLPSVATWPLQVMS